MLLLHLGVLWAGEKTRTWDKKQETIWLQPAIVHVLPDAGEINCQMPKVFSFPHCFNDSLSPFFPALLPKQINNSSRGEPLLLVLLPSPLQQYKYRRQAQMGEQKLQLSPAYWLAERTTLFQDASLPLLFITVRHRKLTLLAGGRKGYKVDMPLKCHRAGCHPSGYFQLCTTAPEPNTQICCRKAKPRMLCNTLKIKKSLKSSLSLKKCFTVNTFLLARSLYIYIYLISVI